MGAAMNAFLPLGRLDGLASGPRARGNLQGFHLPQLIGSVRNDSGAPAAKATIAPAIAIVIFG